MRPYNIKKKNLFIISNRSHLLAEGPIWDYKYNRFLFVDIKKKNFYIYKKNLLKKFSLKKKITSILLTKSERFIVLITSNSIIKYDTLKKKKNYSFYKGNFKNERFNDSYVVNKSTILVSSMDNNEKKNIGKLYIFKNLNKKKILLDNFTIGNGIDFCKINKVFYFSISDLGLIKSFKIKNEKIIKTKIFCNIPKKYGLPDGITVDVFGSVWVACWGGSCLLRYNRYGKIRKIYKIPEKYPTSLCFGGKNINKIYFTSAKNKKTKKLGNVFYFNSKIRGNKSNYLSI